MNKGGFIGIFCFILVTGICLYSYLDLQNRITQLQIRVPHLSKEVARIQEENARLLYEIKAFESPDNLMRIASENAFAHLKFPKGSDVLSVAVPEKIKGVHPAEQIQEKTQTSIHFATGARP